MDNGRHVAAFEEAFADYVGARYAIAMANGTATLHTALAALGVGEDRECRVAVPPLTMSATTIAVLHAGGVPVFVDIDPDTWLMDGASAREHTGRHSDMGVSLYGLHGGGWDIDDAAQTLRPHSGCAFTSYSFQASKILALGEGGMLCTDDEDLARKAREFSSLGYLMDPNQPRIDPAVLKNPTYKRHHSLGYNYRMSDIVAKKGRGGLTHPGGFSFDALGNPTECNADRAKYDRRRAASYYREVIDGCDWITPQHVSEGWTHDYWCYTVALELPEMWDSFTAAVVRHGGEMPYGAWALTYQEPAFRHLAEDGCCPVAEDLQPRLVQFQTNNLTSARLNADAVAAAIKELNG